MNQRCCNDRSSALVDRGTNAAKIFDVIVGGFRKRGNVIMKGKGGVEYHAKVADR